MLAVGAATNALLALVVHLSRRVSDWGMVDDIVFWGVNFGLITFVIGLTFEVTGLVMLSVPIMGLSLLTAIAVHIRPLSHQPTSTSVPG